MSNFKLLYHQKVGGGGIFVQAIPPPLPTQKSGGIYTPIPPPPLGFTPVVYVNPHLQVSGSWMDHMYSHISVYLRVIFFGTPYAYIVSGSATGFFSCGEISAFFSKTFFFISVVILNSSLHYQTFKFDINIQILVWVIGSTYRKLDILKQKWHVNSQFFYCYTRYTMESHLHSMWSIRTTYSH